jgi:hypothetical protein
MIKVWFFCFFFSVFIIFLYSVYQNGDKQVLVHRAGDIGAEIFFEMVIFWFLCGYYTTNNVKSGKTFRKLIKI